MLSRVVWPKCKVDLVLQALSQHQGALKRVCIQALNYPEIVDDLCELVGRIKDVCALPISVSCQPLTGEDVKCLASAGAQRIGIALDAATPEVFDRVKGAGVGGPYRWRRHLKALDDARAELGDRVSTHLIVGMGETEQEAIEMIQFLHDRGITVGLFAFTPIPGTPLAKRSQPNVSSYRRIQLARHLIVNNLTKAKRMRFEDGRLVDFGASQVVVCAAVNFGEPFRTSGCPDCNRPFYNESPRGPIYNYPRKPTWNEIKTIKSQLSSNF